MLNELAEFHEKSISGEILPPPSPERRYSLPQIERLLAGMSPDNTGKIRNVGLAMHHYFAGNQDARESFLAWAVKGGEYTEGEASALWETADPNHPNPISIGTVFKIARDQGVSLGGLNFELSDSGRRFAALTETGADVDYVDFPDMEKYGPLGKSQANIEAFLETFGIGVAFDVFADEICVIGVKDEKILNDHTLRMLWLGADSFGLRCPKDFFTEAIFNLANHNKQHPVRTYLSQIEWDGIPRSATWVSRVTGANDTPLNRAIGETFLIGAVRRILKPGSKVDMIPVFEGHQGGGKSTMLRTLCPDDSWFSDSLEIGSTNKEVIEQTRGKWICELPELTGMRKKEVEHVKVFSSRQSERARMSYDRCVTDKRREFVCAGTTNDDKYLRDKTGNRRWGPVATKAKDFDLVWLRENRDQLWAEAVVLEKTAAYPVTISPALWEAAKIEQGMRVVDDLAEEFLADTLNDGDLCGFIRIEDLRQALLTQNYHRAAGDGALIRRVLVVCGWEDAGQQRFGTKKPRVWKKGRVAAKDMIQLPASEANTSLEDGQCVRMVEWPAWLLEWREGDGLRYADGHGDALAARQRQDLLDT